MQPKSAGVKKYLSSSSPPPRPGIRGITFFACHLQMKNPNMSNAQGLGVGCVYPSVCQWMVRPNNFFVGKGQRCSRHLEAALIIFHLHMRSRLIYLTDARARSSIQLCGSGSGQIRFHLGPWIRILNRMQRYKMKE